jgi:parallel beta-helix repeat protein
MNIRVHVQGIIGLICGLALLGGLVHAQKGEAATYYVATDGSDSNPGMEDQPFQTLDRGVQALSPGDTLYVENGTYTSWGMWHSPSGTSWNNPVTIAAYPGHSPVIAGGLYFANNRYMVIDGFVISGIEITWGYGGIADHIRIQNSEIAYTPSTGIFVSEGSDGNEFVNLQVHDNGTTDFDHGIYIRSSDNVVAGCSIYNNAGWGVQLYSPSGSGVNNNIIRDNTIYDNGRSGIRGDGILVSSGSGNQVYNNIVWGNLGIGIRIDYNASDTYVANNTVYGNGSLDVYME